MYSLQLTVEKEKSSLTLFEDGATKMVREWQESRDMGSHLFQAIDDILKEVGIGPDTVDNFSVDVKIPETYTSGRIAETVAKTYGFAVKSVPR